MVLSLALCPDDVKQALSGQCFKFIYYLYKFSCSSILYQVIRMCLKIPLTGPLFPIGIQNLIYIICFCYGSSNGY